MIYQGKVTNVTAVATGASLETAAVAGAASITVDDATVFQGVSQLQIGPNPQIYQITSVTPENASIGLSPAVAGAADEGESVYVYPFSEEKQAQVQLGESDDVIIATVPHALYDNLPEGIRDLELQESVTVEPVRSGWVVQDIVAETPLLGIRVTGAEENASAALAVSEQAAADVEASVADLADARTRLSTAETNITASADEITAAKLRLTEAESDANQALSDALAASQLAGTKTTTFAQISPPSTTGRTNGDLWTDTDDGNKVYVWDGAWTPRLLGTPAIGFNATDIGGAPRVVSGAPTEKTFYNVLTWGQNGVNIGGYLVINTPITFSNKMTSVRVRGYNYLNGGSDIDLTASGYIYAATNTTLSLGFTNVGSMKISARYARNIATGTWAIILKSEQDGNRWQYPKIAIPEVTIGYTASPDSWVAGWSAGIVADDTALAAAYDNMVTPQVYDAGTVAASAASLAQTAKTAADSKVTVYRQSAAPVGTFVVNDLWLDTDDGLVYYASTTAGGWTLHSDQRILAVVNSNATKTTVFAQTSAPSTTGRTIGDLWIDTDDGNKVYDWSGSWTARTLGAAAISATARQLGAVTVYRQSAAPVGTFVIGDLWMDSDDGLAYIATTTAGGWTLHSDQRIGQVVTSNAAKTTVFVQPSQPSTTGRTLGDLWMDSDDGNKVYDWSGSWTPRQLGDSALANLDINKLNVVGTANLNLAVAQAIAAKTASFQQVDVSNLTATGTVAMQKAVAQELAARVGEFLLVRANNLEATMALVSKLTSGGTGRRWEADPDGIRLFDVDGSLIVNFPTDPSTPALVDGDLVARSLTVSDQLAIRGLVNEISKGAQVVLAGGTTAPSSPPSVAIDWESKGTSVGEGDFEGYNPGRHGLVRWNGSWWMAHSGLWSKAWLQRYTESSTDLVSAGSASLADRIPDIGMHQPTGGLSVLGTTLYVLGSESLDWNVNQWVVEGYNTSGARTARWVWTKPANSSNPVLWNNGTNLYLSWVRTTDGKLMWRPFAPTTGVAQAVETATGMTVSTAAVPAACYYGNADLGAARLWVVFENTSVAYAVDGSAALQIPDHFPTPNGKVRGLAYDGGVFWSHDPSGKKLYKHTTSNWGAADSSLWHASVTWYDGDATGGAHQTAQSPRKSFTMKKRARLIVTAPPLPARPVPNTTDDAKAAVVYLGRGNTDPGRTKMELQAVLPDGQRTYVASTVILPAGANLAVNQPPATSDFPVTSPGRLVSADLTSFVVNGDGTGTWGGMLFSAGTTPGVAAPAMRPQKKKDAVGRTATVAANTYTTTNATVADTGLSFVAPPSGAVKIFLSALCRSATAGQYVKVDYNIRTGGTVGAGTVIYAGDNSIATCMISSTSSTFEQYHGSDVYTGLTPGVTYNIYPVMNGNSGQSVTVAGSTLIVEPSL